MQEVTEISPREWRAIKNGVGAAAEGVPPMSEWLDRAAAVHPVVAEAVEGIWTGRDGKVKQMMRGGRHMLVVGWHEGRVEYSYVS